MKQPFKLADSPISHDTVAALESLLADAKRGSLIGFAFAAMYGRGDYIVDMAGEAHRSPTFTRGMILALDDSLRDLVHHK